MGRQALALTYGAPERPFCSEQGSSLVAQCCCPWGVRSPRGEFLRERGRLKIVALGSGPIFVLLRSGLLLHSGLKWVPLLGSSVSFTQTPPPLSLSLWYLEAKGDKG